MTTKQTKLDIAWIGIMIMFLGVIVALICSYHYGSTHTINYSTIEGYWAMTSIGLTIVGLLVFLSGMIKQMIKGK